MPGGRGCISSLCFFPSYKQWILLKTSLNSPSVSLCAYLLSLDNPFVAYMNRFSALYVLLSQFCVLQYFVGNVGQDHAVFEQGASAGNVGNENILEQKKANPVALLLSSAMMLRHLQFPSFADRLEMAVKRVIGEGKFRTKDLGGTSTTQEVSDAVIANLD
jgi:hypothetical protein